MRECFMTAVAAVGQRNFRKLRFHKVVKRHAFGVVVSLIR